MNSNLNYSNTDIVDISFDLSIDGTSHKPSEVRAVFNYEGQSYGTLVSNISDNKWNASFDLSKIPNLKNLVQLVIEVVINGRLFKPVKKDITISEVETSNQVELIQSISNNFQDELKTAIEKTNLELVKPSEESSISESPIALPQVKLDLFKSVVIKEQKKTIKFDKIKKPKNTNNVIEELKIEVPPMEFSIPINKKKIAPKKPLIEEFEIIEDKIIYL